jgi:hypothetical protein
MERRDTPSAVDRLPQPLVEADRALFTLLGRVVTSKFLNPTNEVEARAAFESGRAVRFTYAPAAWADEFLRALDRIRPPLDHPLGAVLDEAIREERAMAVALRDRSAKAMDVWARAAGWLDAPDSAVASAFPARPPEEATVGARELSAALAGALRDRGLHTWRVEADPVMSARVMVDSLRNVVRVNPRATCTPTEVRALVAHEIGVHVARAAAGAQQPLAIFRHGLPGSLQTEEGLALYAEAETTGLPDGTVGRLGFMAKMALRAREVGFSELAREIRMVARANPWPMVLRLKRGLADPEQPGAYAKDRVYWLGILSVGQFVARGGNRAHLMIGKVGVQHPIDEWRRLGWIKELGSGRSD